MYPTYIPILSPTPKQFRLRQGFGGLASGSVVIRKTNGGLLVRRYKLCRNSPFVLSGVPPAEARPRRAREGTIGRNTSRTRMGLDVAEVE